MKAREIGLYKYSHAVFVVPSFLFFFLSLSRSLLMQKFGDHPMEILVSCFRQMMNNE